MRAAHEVAHRNSHSRGLPHVSMYVEPSASTTRSLSRTRRLIAPKNRVGMRAIRRVALSDR